AGAGALRLARDPGAAGRLPHDHHADLVVLPVPAQGRAGRRVLAAAAAGDGAAAARAEAAARPPRLRRRGRQGQPAAPDPARPLAYGSNRRLVIGHQVVSFLALAPIVIPGVVLAVALFIAYTRPPFVLYGTLAILFVAYLTKEMPTGYAQSDATFRGIPPDLED